MSTTHEVRKHLRPQQRDETIHSPRRRRVIVALAVVGVVGIVGSAVVAVLLGLTRPGYSFVAEPVVALMSGQNAWIQDINFVVLGVSVVGAAIGLHLAARRSRWGGLGPALLALSGLGPVLAGVTAPMPVHFRRHLPGRRDRADRAVTPDRARPKLGRPRRVRTGDRYRDPRRDPDPLGARVAAGRAAAPVVGSAQLVGARAVGDVHRGPRGQAATRRTHHSRLM
jgi:hypothetical protein